MRTNLIVALKGALIGASMLVPGVSGGSMAMILGIYDKLVSSVNSFLKKPKSSILFLGLFCAGALVGMVLFAKPLMSLIGLYPMIMMYFFMGTVLGSIPMIFNKAEVKKFDLSVILWIAAGFVIVYLLGKIPTGLINIEGNFMMTVVILIVAGVVAAVALVLPGISVSYMFLLLGIYETIIKSISTLNIPFLAPLDIGLILGIFGTTSVLETAMKKAPKPTYLMILGFLFGSVMEIFPGIPQGFMIIPCLILMALAAGLVWKISFLE